MSHGEAEPSRLRGHSGFQHPLLCGLSHVAFRHGGEKILPLPSFPLTISHIQGVGESPASALRMATKISWVEFLATRRKLLTAQTLRGYTPRTQCPTVNLPSSLAACSHAEQTQVGEEHTVSGTTYMAVYFIALEGSCGSWLWTCKNKAVGQSGPRPVTKTWYLL